VTTPTQTQTNTIVKTQPSTTPTTSTTTTSHGPAAAAAGAAGAAVAANSASEPSEGLEGWAWALIGAAAAALLTWAVIAIRHRKGPDEPPQAPSGTPGAPPL
jgi:hypothetical protein